LKRLEERERRLKQQMQDFHQQQTQPQTQGLNIGTVIDADSPSSAEEANRSKKRRIIVGVIVSVFAIGGGVAGFFSGQQVSNNEPLARCFMLEEILVYHDPLHADAKNWLCYNDTWVPPADDFDTGRLWNERYAMAVFYYSTIGNGWDRNHDWLSSKSVCDWYATGDDDPCGGSDSRVTNLTACESCLSLFPPVAQLQQVCHLT
jgi:hypothetical protein